MEKFSVKSLAEMRREREIAQRSGLLSDKGRLMRDARLAPEA